MVTVEMLKRFPLLAYLPVEDLSELMEICEIETWEKGEVFAREREPADRLRLVLLGKVALDKRIQLGRHGSVRRATVGIVGPGGAVGWSALVAPYVFTLSGVCLESCKFIALDARLLQDFMARNPRAAYKLMEGIAELVGTRLRDMTDTLTYFLSIVSHELKAPLAAVENYLEVILGGFTGELTPKQQRMLERSVLRIHDLSGLINDLLDLARMRPEQIQAEFVRFNPREFGDRSVEDTRLAAKEKGITIRVLAPKEFRDIVGAPRRLRQVLTNLLSNAIKFSPSGSTVTLRSWETDDELWVEVSDEGIGIPAEDQAHIFEDFFRARNVSEVNGAGLGLSIAKKIVDAHQGRIWLESPYEEGKPGTRFTVVLPRNLPLPGE
ncbi:MAG TPA: cyclic nucleotide-binding domain-containing protein [Chloroflexi bacterium]|nr:cyclic nucleotide-binding domain-containing protein [Chloroflexota bacterium]